MSAFSKEKCTAALYSLAASSETLQHRISNAFCNSLMLLKPDKDIDGEEKEEFIKIDNTLSKHNHPQKGAILASAENLTNDEASDLARDIVSFCLSVIEKG